jgi:hypothetical protein
MSLSKVWHVCAQSWHNFTKRYRHLCTPSLYLLITLLYLLVAREPRKIHSSTQPSVGFLIVFNSSANIIWFLNHNMLISE